MLPSTLAIASLRQTSRLRFHTGTKRSDGCGNRRTRFNAKVDAIGSTCRATATFCAHRDYFTRPALDARATLVNAASRVPSCRRRASTYSHRFWAGRRPSAQASVAQFATGELDEQVLEVRRPMQVSDAGV